MEQEKRRQVLEAARAKFEQFGFKKTTVDEIAREAGISKRTLYEMFESKEKIISELVMTEALSARKNIMGRLEEIRDPVKRMKTFTRMSMDYFSHNPFLGRVLGDNSGLYAPFLKEEIKAIEEGIEGIYLSILRFGINKGVFRAMDEQATANCIFILFRSFTYANTLKPNKAWLQFISNAILKDNCKS